MNCVQCGAPCSRKHCSARCEARYRRGKVEVSRPCTNPKCSETIPPTARADKQFCSKNCARQYRYDTDDEYCQTCIDQATTTSSRVKRYSSEGDITPFEWVIVKDYYGRCLKCDNTEKPLTLDHVIPLSLGGNNDIFNCQPLCFSCNSSKGATIVDYRSGDDIANINSALLYALEYAMDDFIGFRESLRLNKIPVSRMFDVRSKV